MSLHTRRPRRPYRLEQPILSLLVNPDDQRPWSEDELVRELFVAQEQLADPLERLQDAGLIHRYSGLVSATHAAVRMYEIEQAANPATERERRLEEMILMVLLAHPDDAPSLTERDVIDELGEDRELDIANAFDNLDGIGLVDRSQSGIRPTQAARVYTVTLGVPGESPRRDADARE